MLKGLKIPQFSLFWIKFLVNLFRYWIVLHWICSHSLYQNRWCHLVMFTMKCQENIMWGKGYEVDEKCRIFSFKYSLPSCRCILYLIWQEIRYIMTVWQAIQFCYFGDGENVNDWNMISLMRKLQSLDDHNLYYNKWCWHVWNTFLLW